MPKLTEQLTELDAQLTALFKEMEGYTEAQLNAKPSENAWSATQVMHHLMLSEKYSVQYCRKKLSFNPKLKKANWRTNLSYYLLDFYLWLPVKIGAPKMIATPMLPVHSTLPDIKKEWAILRKDLHLFIKETPAELFDKELYKHPLIGRMTIGGMVHFFQGHFKRHHRQIKRTLK